MAAASGTAMVASVPKALLWQVAVSHLMRSPVAWVAKSLGNSLS